MSNLLVHTAIYLFYNGHGTGTVRQIAQTFFRTCFGIKGVAHLVQVIIAVGCV